jgi:regulator of protease activity HflC (stomatin/prohibitin superfamily)
MRRNLQIVEKQREEEEEKEKEEVEAEEEEAASRRAEASKTAYGARKTASNTPEAVRSLTTPAAQAHAGGGVHAHGGGGGGRVEGEGGGGSEKRQQVRAMIHKVKNSPAALRKQKPPESPAQLGAKIRSISAQKCE